MIEKWVTITSSQKYEKVDDALDDSLPPWVSSSRPLQEHNYSIIDSPPAIKSEKNSQGFVDDSEWSLPEVNDTEEYSIPATNNDLPLYSGPDDELEIYRTPCDELSPTNDPMGPLLTESLPIEILEEEAFIIEPLPEECYVPEVEPKPHNAFHNENNNDDSQATTQYNAQERVRFDSQETVRFDLHEAIRCNTHKTVRFDSQETVQFDTQETMSQGSQSREPSTSGNTHKAEAYDLNSFQISTKIDSQEGPNIPDPYTPIFDYRPNPGNSSPTNSSHYENAEDNASPCLLFSPFNDNNSLPHLSPPRVNPVLQFDFFEDLLSIPVKETKLDEPDISTTRKHYLQDDSGILSSSRSKSATKFQRLDEPAVITDTKKEKGKQKDSSSGHSVESQEPIKLVRPEKRQVRSSVLKTDKTIETYFSNSLGTSQEEGELGKIMLFELSRKLTKLYYPQILVEKQCLRHIIPLILV